MKDVKSVVYNDGENDNFALVIGNPGNHELHLHVVPNHGACYTKLNVPHREPEDYDANGGGVTWKNA